MAAAISTRDDLMPRFPSPQRPVPPCQGPIDGDDASVPV